MTKICNILFEQLNIEDIRYCHFKSNEHLEDGLDGTTDLDVLVDENDFQRMKEVLNKFGYREFEPNEFCKYPGVTNWYGFDSETGAIIHIHLHTHLITGKSLVKDYVIPWDKEILDNTILHECGVKVNNPNMELLLLFTRMVVKRNGKQRRKSCASKVYFEEDEWGEVIYLRKLIEEEKFMFAYETTLGLETYDKFKDMILRKKEICRKEFNEFERYIRKYLKCYRRLSPIKADVSSFAYRARRKIYIYINKYLNKTLPVKKRMEQQGPLIAFIGIDGSGKSTMIYETRKWLSEEFDVQKYYLGAGDGNQSFVARTLIKGYQLMVKSEDDNAAKTSNMTRTEVYNVGVKAKIKGVIASYTYLKIAQNNLKNIRKAYKFCQNGGIALCDRFPQSCIEVMHDGMKVQRYERAFSDSKIIRYLSAKERMTFEKIEKIEGNFYIFRLNIDPLISYQRKKENEKDASERVEKARTINSLSFKNIVKIVEIDANKSIEDVILSIKRSVWEVF